VRTCTSLAAVAATAVLLLAGCSSGSGHDSTAKPSASQAPTATASNPGTTVTPTPSPTPTAYTIGQSWPWSNSTGATGATTVLGYKQPVLQNDPPGTSLGVPAGSQWGRLDIRVCEKAGPSIGVGQDAWHVQFRDGSQADTTGLNGGDFPKPEFPQDGTVRAGGCARGGIMFPIPKGQRPVQVVYAPESAPEPVYWDLPVK
jgi:hypothetical protein